MQNDCDVLLYNSLLMSMIWKWIPVNNICFTCVITLFVNLQGGCTNSELFLFHCLHYVAYHAEQYKAGSTVPVSHAETYIPLEIETWFCLILPIL